MSRTLLFLFALGSASAATIVTTATCVASSGSYTYSGSTGASCQIGAYPNGEVIAQASASMTHVSIYTTVAGYGGPWGPNGPYGYAYAYAHYSATFEFTVTGGSGSGFVTADLSSWGDHGYGSASFTSSPASGYGSSITFTYDVPEIVNLDLEARTGGGAVWGAAAYADFNGFRFFDANGDPLSNVDFSMTELEAATPEPGSFAACGLLLSVLLFVRRRDT